MWAKAGVRWVVVAAHEQQMAPSVPFGMAETGSRSEDARLAPERMPVKHGKKMARHVEKSSLGEGFGRWGKVGEGWGRSGKVGGAARGRSGKVGEELGEAGETLGRSVGRVHLHPCMI